MSAPIILLTKLIISKLIPGVNFPHILIKDKLFNSQPRLLEMMAKDLMGK
jgi:hypothetical protein